MSAGAHRTATSSTAAANDHTITRHFAIRTFTITPTAGANGSISPATAQTVNYGGSQTFNINPNTGYAIADVLVDGVSQGPIASYQFTNVTGNRTISASFVIRTFTITPTAGANGSISPATAQTVNYGGSQTFNINPNTGYAIADVLVDGVSQGPIASYQFTNVTGNTYDQRQLRDPHLHHHADRRRQRLHQPGHGADGELRRQPDLHINPNTGYAIADVLVDGVSQGPIASYQFTNVTGNRTISASFVIRTFTITPTAGANGSISPARRRP